MQELLSQVNNSEITISPTRVRVVEYSYLVDFGPGTQPRFHTVSKQRCCSCEMETTCPAITAVTEYLQNGGQRAPEPMPPCPICGSQTIPDRGWNGKYTREPGWRCTQGGLTHFLEAKARRIQETLRQIATSGQ